jgi:hypothetical protein
MKYYIYQHVRLDTNEIFYIGKGTKKGKGNAYIRAFTKNSRNQYWKNITQLTSYKVEILEEYESEQDCLKRETELIILHGYSWDGTGTLCNMVKDDQEIKRLARIQAKKKNSKEVHQYDLDGNYLKSFPSITDAIKEYPCDIYNAASERHFTAGGFQWRTIKHDKLQPYSEELNEIQNSKLIYQYDIDNNFIKEWNGTKQPSEKLGIHRGAIRNCLSGIVKTAGSFKWSYSKLLKDDSIKQYGVYKEDQLIFSNDSLKKCSEHLNLNPYSVSVYLRRGKSYKGYIFKCHNIKTQNEKDGKRN